MSALRWRPPRYDVVLVAVLCVWAFVPLVISPLVDRGDRGEPFPPPLVPWPGPPIPEEDPAWRAVGDVVATIAMTLPLLWRRRFPLATFGVQMLLVAAVADGTPDTAFPALLVGVYSAAAFHPRKWVSLAFLTAIAAWVAVAFGQVTPDIPDLLTPFALLLPLWLVGNQVRQSRALAAASAARAEEATQAALEQERSRIARELHDVVTHNVSVMVIQASAARQVIDSDPVSAREAMGAVERVGQDAMAELRHLLDLLGASEPSESLVESPQPGLHQLDGLLSNVRAAGLSVTAETTGVPRPLPPGLDVAAYRIVQEGLTNVLRHAPGAAAVVRIDYGSSELTVEVSNEAPVEGGRPGTGGRGLVGLAERVHLYGGSLEAGHRPDGGYRLRARIPWEDGTP